jgi:hypothetical protein
MSAKYSGGPNRSATRTSAGAARVRSTVAIVPATKEPTAAVVKAAPARPPCAILNPSSVVTADAASPGVFTRMEVVEPPYIAP